MRIDRNATYLRGYLAAVRKRQGRREGNNMSPFDIGKRVRIKSTGMVGTIIAQYRNEMGVQWEVQYANTTGQIFSLYVPEQGLEIVE